ncbi:xanthine dehydrogenase family protein molybdopterin-binding subunit [Dehalobacter sp. DCM]|uniref:xanthine dehydrogenase family protein molybdopterin-binding subunit n=1 Tax=Dehalobacter sp. DCM TaxID=2907827 RepID=UPI00308179B4|nr:xanthine dehydrogenase family protein molybdopterin-binding subunit [Dehalobacter sp. DCM]
MIKSKHDYKYVGKQTVRKDAYGIVQGKTQFFDDFVMPNILIGKVKQCPYPHANILSIDTSKALTLEGVHAVITYKDCDPNWKFGWPPQKSVLGTRMRFVGDAVALVAAETEELAKEAIDLIEVNYEVLEPVFDVLEAQKEGAPQLYDEFPNNIVPGGYEVMQPSGRWWHLKKGDVENGFAECAIIEEDTIGFDKKPGTLSPEPPGLIIQWEGGTDYHVWGTTQGIMVLQLVNATVIPGVHIEATAFNVGGSYGNKTTLTNITIYGMLLAKATNRPIKMNETKVEQMVMHETRLGSTVQAKIGMDKEGVVRSVKALWSVDAGHFCNAIQGQVSVGLGEAQLIMCKCPNWDLDTRIITTNKLTAGTVRGYGGQELNSCLSLLMARAMRKGNFDPVDSFRKNYCQAGDKYFWRDGREWTARSVDYNDAILATAEKFRWKDRWKGWGIPSWVSEDGKKVRGVGCSVIGNSDAGESFAEAYVRIIPDMFKDEARVMVHINVTEIGNGQKSNLLKMVAEILNVPLEAVQTIPPDSRTSPRNEGLAGSRGTLTCGRAVSNAALDLRRQLFEAAEYKLRYPQEQMEMFNFGVRAKSKPELWVPVTKLVPDHHLTMTGYGRHDEDFGTPNFFMSFIEAEVDLETGMTKVIDMLGGTDVGQIIDPGSLEMQCQGGIGAASLDTALFEENFVDPVIGRPLTYDMIQYKWRPFNELPNFDTCILESQFDTNYFRAIGVGEISGAAAASACMMAISNAIGTEIKDYPATPDVILKALGKI